MELANRPSSSRYDIVICDEAQDLSANQVRAVTRHLKSEHSLTFVLDAAQRIYPRGFTWIEAGVEIRPVDVKSLSGNFRNTVEIAALARPLLEGLELTDDGTLPDLDSCERHGPKPRLVEGRFSQQIRFVIDTITKEIDLVQDSVCIMQLRGGHAFDYTKSQLNDAGLPFVEISRRAEWPRSATNLGISTLHSAKGLEFDHVYILGLNAEFTPHGPEDQDTQLEAFRRLLAMAITRSRKSVTLGTKPSDRTQVLDYLDPATYNTVAI